MMLKRAVTAAAVLAATAAAVTSCSSGTGPLTYAPAAYGVSGHCYYVNSPAEAVALQAAGLCLQSWAPTPMPSAWEDEYYSYYDSPAYYDTYVPVKVRTVYVQRETTFGKSNRTAITARSKSATYKSSAGTIVKGTSVTAKTRFGSGKSFGTSGQKYGGGSLRSGGSAGSGSSSSKTGSTGSVSKSSSSRSGSLRSGSSGSHSSGSHR
jgi:hypothetical protein